MDVGATLRGARERRGLSLGELARRTKISPRVLRAIEDDAFDTVPPGIFTRGFLRAYSREVGLDPAVMVAQFRADFEPPAEPAPRKDTGDLPDDTMVIMGHRAYQLLSGSGSEAGKAVAIAFVSLGLVTYFSLGSQRDGAADPEPALAIDGAISPPASTGRMPAVLLTSDSDSPQPVATAGEVFEIEIRATGPCWVEASVDGARRIYRLMQAGDRETLTVHEAVALRVGNPAAFAFSMNGRPGHLSGRPGQPVTIRIDADSLAGFLAR